MIRLARTLMLALALMLSAVSLSHAQPVSVHAGFSAWVPDSWSINQLDKYTTATKGPGGVPYVSFEVPSKKVTLKEASRAYGKEIGKTLSNLEFGKTNNATINGMPAQLLDGTGTLKGKPVKFTIAAYQSSRNRFLITFAMAPASVYDQNLNLLVKILRSVKG